MCPLSCVSSFSHQNFNSIIFNDYFLFKDLPINKKVWNFKTLGMTAVGQDEILLLLVQMSGKF